MPLPPLTHAIYKLSLSRKQILLLQPPVQIANRMLPFSKFALLFFLKQPLQALHKQLYFPSHLYTATGAAVDTFEVGVIPGEFTFTP